MGFATANNQAIHRCNGRYILLLNPDTAVNPGALTTLVDFMDASPYTGAAGAKLINKDGTLQVSCFPRPTLMREFWRLFHLDKVWPLSFYRVEKWPPDQPHEAEILMGACLIVRKEIFDQVGMLDSEYFMYSEEMDLCYRIKKAGWQLSWVPLAVVFHYGGQSTVQIAEKMFLQLYMSKVQYFRKIHGRMAAEFYKLILLIASVGRLILAPMAYVGKAHQRKHRLYLVRQYLRLMLALTGF